MIRFVVVLLSFAYAFSETIAFSFDGVKDSSGLIRIPLSPRRRRAADENGLTKITMENVGDLSYGFPVEIGTPPQKFDVMLDSGSPDLWVAWKKAKGQPECGGICTAKNYFDESASSTFQKVPKDFFLGFIGGSTNGTIGVETISVGGLTVKNQPFGLVYSGIKPTSYDGIIGLTYPAFSQTDNTTIIDRFVEQGQTKKRIACIKLRPEKVSKSEFIIGGCDVAADSYAPVMQINNAYTGWRIKLTKMVLRSTEDNSELLTFEPNHETVLDTGAGTSLGLPTKYMKGVADKLGATQPSGSSHHLVDCANKTKLPNIDFHFGEAIVTLTPDVYSWTYYDECQIGLYDNGADGTFFFGIVFFNAGTVIFDRESNQIGFAK